MRALKICLAAAAAAIFIFLLAALPKKLCFDSASAQSYAFFCGNTSADCREVDGGAAAGLKRLFLSDVCGETATFKDFDLGKFLAEVNGTILFEERLQDSVNYYLSADLPYSVKIGGYVVNAHVCVRDDGVKVGSPIIFGGY